MTIERRYSADGAAAFLREMFGLQCSVKTLANWRSEGRGPIYSRLKNGRVSYAESALIDYAEDQLGPTVRNTREERSAGVDLAPGGPAARAAVNDGQTQIRGEAATADTSEVA